MGEWRAHTVTIANREMGKIFVAYLREGVGYNVKLHYDSLFRDLINWRGALNQILVGAGELLKDVESVYNRVKGLFDQFLVSGWTFSRKIGGIPDHLEFDIPVRLWVEDDIDEIRSELRDLYDMTIPELKDKIDAVDIDRYKVVVMIGEWFMMDECYVTGINHRWSETMVTDGGMSAPAYLDLDISITSVYTMARQFWDLSERIQVRTGEAVKNLQKYDDELKQSKEGEGREKSKIPPPVVFPTIPDYI